MTQYHGSDMKSKFTPEQRRALEEIEEIAEPQRRRKCKGLMGKLFGHKYVEQGLPNGVHAYLECVRCGDIVE